MKIDILGFITSVPGALISGFLLSIILKPIISNTIKLIKNKFVKSSLEKIKDPEFRELIYKMIAKAQKELASESGQVKFEAVKNWVLKLTPDTFDVIVSFAIQELYEEMKKPL